MPLLSLSGVAVSRGGRKVLHDVSMTLTRGEIVTIVGPNGSGKTTLLQTLIGALKVDRGQIEKAPDLKIGYVPQKLGIDMTLPMTVDRFLNLPVKRSATSVLAVLEEVGVPHLAKKQIRALSGGQLQRVMLARALLGAPDVLILDEATQGLDQPGSAAFYRTIEEVRSTRGCAVLMVSHELHVVMAASDRVICLNGHVCCEGTPELVSTAPEYRALFGTGTKGALALYRHEHTHDHDHGHHDHGHRDSA